MSLTNTSADTDRSLQVRFTSSDGKVQGNWTQFTISDNPEYAEAQRANKAAILGLFDRLDAVKVTVQLEYGALEYRR